jgi:hypothetical protein
MRRVIKTVFQPDGSPAQIPVLRDLYIVTIPVDLISFDGAQVIRNVNFDSDSDFIWTKTTYQVSVGNSTEDIATNPVPTINVEIKDTSSSRDFQSAPLHISNLAGRGTWPYILPEPRTFKANSTAQFKFTNFIDDGVTEYTDLYLNLIGYKEWR